MRRMSLEAPESPHPPADRFSIPPGLQFETGAIRTPGPRRRGLVRRRLSRRAGDGYPRRQDHRRAADGLTVRRWLAPTIHRSTLPLPLLTASLLDEQWSPPLETFAQPVTPAPAGIHLPLPEREREGRVDGKRGPTPQRLLCCVLMNVYIIVVVFPFELPAPGDEHRCQPTGHGWGNGGSGTEHARPPWPRPTPDFKLRHYTDG